MKAWQTFSALLSLACVVFGTCIHAAEVQSLDDPSFSDITVTTEGPVMVIELSSPPINGVSVKVLEGINAAMDIAMSEEDIQAIVLTGQEELFSGGAGEITDGPDGLSHAAYAIQTFNRMEHLPMPIVAGINGLVGQGGNELAMATDIRILGENAIVTQMEVQVGLIPGFGGLQRLPRLVGRGVANEMMLLGRVLTATDAKTLGYAAKVTAVAETRTEAIATAMQMVDTLGPVSLKVYKARYSDSRNETFDEALKKDQFAFDQMFGTPEFEAAFAKFNKRMEAQK